MGLYESGAHEGSRSIEDELPTELPVLVGRFW